MYSNNAKDDPRVVRTERMLKNAFMSLLEEKDYDQITVTDIASTAGYNRATFYNHFKYKDELVEDLVREKMEAFSNAFLYPFLRKNSGDSLIDSIVLFDYILNNDQFFLLFMTHKDMSSMLSKKLLDTIIILLKKVYPADLYESEAKYNAAITIQAYGIWGLIIEWIKSGYDASPQFMSEQLTAILEQKQYSTLLV